MLIKNIRAHKTSFIIFDTPSPSVDHDYNIYNLNDIYKLDTLSTTKL